MTSEERTLLKEDLKAQALEHSRRLLVALGKMIEADSTWKQDTFYKEAMTHFAETSQKIGEWRLKSRTLL